jgi:hypothetical protein
MADFNNCCPDPCSPSSTLQVLSVDVTTGDIELTPGNTINVSQLVKNFESQSQLVGARIVGSNILEITFRGENAVLQIITVTLPNSVVPTETPITTVNSNTLTLTASGSVDHTLTGAVRIDGTGTAPVTAGSNGIKIDCCPQTPLVANDSNTIDFTTSGSDSHTLTGSVKFVDSGSIDFSSNSSGLTGVVKYSTDSGNSAIQGTDGGVYAPTLAGTLSGLTFNGTATATTRLVSDDSKTYILPHDTTLYNPHPATTQPSGFFRVYFDLYDKTASTTITTNFSYIDIPADTNASVINPHFGTGGSANVLFFDTVDLKTGTTLVSNALSVAVTCAQIKPLFTSNQANISNPMVKSYGELQDGSCGYGTINGRLHSNVGAGQGLILDSGNDTAGNAQFRSLLGTTTGTNGGIIVTSQATELKVGLDINDLNTITNSQLLDAGAEYLPVYDSDTGFNLKATPCQIVTNSLIDNVCTPTLPVGHSVSSFIGIDNTGLVVKAPSSSPTPPFVNAGADQSILLPTSTASIVGTATSPSGAIVGTTWQRMSGPSGFTITDQSALTTTISGLVAGSYKFRLVGYDSLGLSAIDDILLTVSNSLTLNTIYYGVKSSSSTPNQTEILAGSTTSQDGSVDVSIDWTALSSSAPVYCWFAIPALGTPYIKNHWSVSVINNGNIGGGTDLFGALSVVSVSSQNYNVWITNFATQFVASCQLIH